MIITRKYALVVVGLVIALIIAAFPFASKVKNDSDMLAFLPQENPITIKFNELAKEFGGLDVALIAVERKNQRSILEQEFLKKLHLLTDELNDLPNVDHALSLINVSDFSVDPKGGIVTGPLIHPLPSNTKEEKALNDKIEKRDHLIGRFISENKNATLIYCFLTPRTSFSESSRKLRSLTKKYFKEELTYFGGNPFISAFLFDTTEHDTRHLVPWAVALMVVLMFISFRNIFGTLLAIGTTALSVYFTYALMAISGDAINLILSSMPLILFAVGSAYNIHILSAYYRIRQTDSSLAIAEALNKSLKVTAPAIIIAALTTIASLLACLFMDLVPMRLFGLYVAIGVSLSFLLTVLFLPAVILITKHQGKKKREHLFTSRYLIPSISYFRRFRKTVFFLFALVLALAIVALSHIRIEMDASQFFPDDSEIARSDRFLTRYFSGSTFMQIGVKGDFTQPEMLRFIRRIGHRLEAMDSSIRVTTISEVICRANEAMTKIRSVPDSADKAKMLFAMVSGEIALKQLVNKDRTHIALQVAVNESKPEKLESLLRSIEKALSHGKTLFYKRFKTDNMNTKVFAIQHSADEITDVIASKANLSLEEEQKLRLFLIAELSLSLDLNKEQFAIELERFLQSEENSAEIPAAKKADLSKKIAQHLILLKPPTFSSDPKKKNVKTWDKLLKKQITDVLKKEDKESSPKLINEMSDDLFFSLRVPYRELYFKQKAFDLAKNLSLSLTKKFSKVSKIKNLVPQIAAIYYETHQPYFITKTDTEKDAYRITFNVNGIPSLNRALNQSALNNQLKSGYFSLISIFILMGILFIYKGGLRGLFDGWIAALPTLFTLIVVYGLMSLLEIRLDIATAMLAVFILGIGVDYGAHFIYAWREEKDLNDAILHSAPAIFTNAITIAAAFFVLTFGDARPLRNLGLLTSSAMFVALLATFCLLPLFDRKKI